jgi:hypothetical protein
VSPPIALHLSIGEGQSDASRAAAGGVNKLVPLLPSAGESGQEAVPCGETSSVSLLPSAPDPGLPKPPLGSMPIHLWGGLLSHLLLCLATFFGISTWLSGCCPFWPQLVLLMYGYCCPVLPSSTPIPFPPLLASPAHCL